MDHVDPHRKEKVHLLSPQNSLFNPVHEKVQTTAVPHKFQLRRGSGEIWSENHGGQAQKNTETGTASGLVQRNQDNQTRTQRAGQGLNTQVDRQDKSR